MCEEASKKYDTYTTLIDQSQGSIMFWKLFGTVMIKIHEFCEEKNKEYRFDGLKKHLG